MKRVTGRKGGRGVPGTLLLPKLRGAEGAAGVGRPKEMGAAEGREGGEGLGRGGGRSRECIERER